MKKHPLILAITACLLIGGFSYLYMLRSVVLYRPADTAAIENALAMPGIFAVAHGDIEGIKSMQSAFYGAADPQALTSILMDSHKHLADRLRNEGVSLNESLSGFVGVMGMSTGVIFHASVLTGRFDAPRWQSAISAAFAAKPVNAGGRKLLEVTLQNEGTCSTSGPFWVDVSPSRIVVATPAVMPLLLANLEQNATAATNVSQWQAFKKGKLASVAFLVPQNASNAIDQPLFKMMVQVLSRKAAPLDMLLLGASPRVLPTPGIVLETELRSANPEWLKQTDVAIVAGLDTILAGEQAKALPSLAAIRSSISTSVEKDTLSIQTVLDKQALQNLSNVAQEGMQIMFGGMMAKGSHIASAQESVTAAKELPVYRTELSSVALEPYKGDFMHKAPDAAAGPFGLTIAANRVSEKDPNSLEVEIAVKSSAIPNLGEESMHQSADMGIASMSVTGATDASGKSVLSTETCGMDRNDMPTSLRPRETVLQGNNGFEKATALQGAKKIRLAAHFPISTVKNISGAIALSLPVKVHKELIAQPLKGKVVQTGDVRMWFKESGAQDVSYDISGKMPYVLAIRALNDKGQYLKSNSASGMSRFLGEGESIHKQFSGNVAQVEVWVADEVEKKSYPFTLASAEPDFTSNSNAALYRVPASSAKEIESLPPAAGCEKGEVQADAAPLTLCVKNIAPVWKGVQASLRVNAPQHPVFKGNLSAVEVRLESLRTSAGTQSTAVPESAFATFRESGRPVALSDSYLTVGKTSGYETLRGQIIRSATGKVIIRVPLAFDSLALDLSQLGVQRVAPNGLKVTPKEIGEGSLRLKLEGPRDSVVQIIPTDEKNQPLATSNESITRDFHDSNVWDARLNVSDKPRYVHVMYASRTDTIEKPFAVTLGMQR